ncbi:hypothetical protein J4470_05440 [Candidatus Woesearchaeota archaeon]|nr:hypothetical protein [Candidatus Woesearchaeota archaeon]
MTPDLNRKGFDFITNWMALLFVAILLLSFLFSAIIVNQWVAYAVVFFAALILGHFLFTSKEGNRFPYYVLAFAFLTGYVIGHKAGNWAVITVLFIAVIAATNKVLKLAQ